MNNEYSLVLFFGVIGVIGVIGGSDLILEVCQTGWFLTDNHCIPPIHDATE
jgi:hypothetical protein